MDNASYNLYIPYGFMLHLLDIDKVNIIFTWTCIKRDLTLCIDSQGLVVFTYQRKQKITFF